MPDGVGLDITVSYSEFSVARMTSFTCPRFPSGVSRVASRCSNALFQVPHQNKEGLLCPLPASQLRQENNVLEKLYREGLPLNLSLDTHKLG